MSNKKSLLSLSVLVILALVLAACAPAATPEPAPPPAEEPTEEPMEEPTEEPTPEPQSIVDIAVADGRFETLVAAVQAAGLAETLSNDGPFTVFAPTDDAFAKLPEGTVEGLLEDIPALTDILLYHVVNGEVLAEDVVMLEQAETLLGENVDIRVEGEMVYINDAQVVITDIMADNGVIHVIDTVLLPPEPLGSIVDIAVADGRFTTLVTALQAAGLDADLAGEGPFTVFAPTDDAFAKLPEGTVESLLEDIPSLSDILQYHVVSGEILAEEVMSLNSAKALNDKFLEIDVLDGMVFINEAQVVITDIQAANGVIHVIDTVLLPPEPVGSIVDIAVADGRFETLVAAVQAADLAETLSSDGLFTVFAPTDDAFAKLPEGTVESLLEDIPTLTDILLYHVVDGRVMAEEVITMNSAKALNDKFLEIEVRDGLVFINDAQVIITDIMADNGVIHVIDTVLLPPEPVGSIVDIAVADGRFETLVAAVEAAGLAETLSSDGLFTVFAPTDEAFAKLPEGTVEALLEDIPALTDILLYHVVDGRLMAEEVITLNQAETLLGETVEIRVEGEMVYINDAQVIITDVMADNGLIHVIDTVLLPPES